MSLPNYLQKIKSSGIYRFVFDKSEIPGNETNTLRLVVGYSEKGPFNTPVYIENESQFRNVYGGISKKLERYGVWFHRMAIQALKVGPILALNLKPFSDEEVEAVNFNPTSPLGEKIKLAVEDVYNTTRFWTLEPEQFEELDSTSSKYITISHTDSTESSNTIFIRGYIPSGYDVSFKEWYSSVLNGEEVPSYLQDYELNKLSQYFAEIYVFKGQFTPQIASSDKLARFFDVSEDEVKLKDYILNAFNEKVDTLQALSENENSNFIGHYSGILLPDFQNAYGSALSLDILFNNDYSSHKMMMNLNQSLLYNEEITLDDIDTTGWNNGFSTKGVMSLKSLDPQVSIVTKTSKGWSYSTTDRDANYNNYHIESYEPINDYTGEFDSSILELGLEEGDKFLSTDSSSSEVATLIKIDNNQLTFDKPISKVTHSNLEVSKEDLIKYYLTKNEDGTYTTEHKYDHLISETTREGDNIILFKLIHIDSKNDNPNNTIVLYDSSIEGGWTNIDGDFTYFRGGVNVDSTYDNAYTTHIDKYTVSIDDNYAEVVNISGSDNDDDITSETSVVTSDASDNTIKVGDVFIYSEYDSPNEESEIIFQGTLKITEIKDDYATFNIIEYPFFSSSDGIFRPVTWDEDAILDMKFFSYKINLTAFTDPNTRYRVLNTNGSETNMLYIINSKVSTTTTIVDTKLNTDTHTSVDDLKDTYTIGTKEMGYYLTKCESSVTYTSKDLYPIYIKGYEYQSKKPNSTKQWDKLKWQQNILNTLTDYKGIRLALTNNTDSRWRYLVDTFEAFVENEVHSKLAIICKEKFNCLGILNFPKMKSFTNCEYTSFKDDDNKLDVQYIVKGGNVRKGVNTKFSLVSEDNGASFVGYYTSVIIQDTYTGVKCTCPSAALISNNYIDKWTTRYPYSIVAGPNYCRVNTTGLIGPDFNFSRSDLDLLEPMGVNCMLYVPLKGTFANSQQTAKQSPVTTLSKISTREIVTYLQDEIEEILQNYQWEFNTQTLRNTIKDKADVVLERIKCNGGIYSYISVCDASNNSDEVINNEMLLLDVSIEPGIGAGKMIQRLYLYRKGGLSSTIVE